MTKVVPKYWIYVHDDQGDLVDDAYSEALDNAIGAASSLIDEWLVDHTNYSVHIVDQHNDSRSVWIAGSCTVEGEA